MSVDGKVYFVRCKSKVKAKFLTVVLNADCMLRSLCSTRESVNNFGTFLWYKIPIPRFDSTKKNHTNLVKLYARAYDTVEKTYETNMSIQKARIYTRVKHYRTRV